MRNVDFLKRSILVIAAVSGPVFACSSTSSSGADGGTSDGGTSTETGTSPDTGGGGGGFKQCPTAGSTCTAAEEDAYTSCILGKCDAQYGKCLGAGYKSGTFTGGACSSFIACTNKCGCNDTACFTKCGTPDQACLGCLLGDVNTCVESSGCKAPACLTPDAGTKPDSGGNPDGGGGGGCTALRACCAQIADPGAQQGCDTVVTAGDEASCGAALSAYKSGGLCN